MFPGKRESIAGSKSLDFQGVGGQFRIDGIPLFSAHKFPPTLYDCHNLLRQGVKPHEKMDRIRSSGSGPCKFRPRPDRDEETATPSL
jgi:hypothetical protein